MEGVNKRSIGKISSLPSSIAKESSNVAASEYIAKLAIGPTPARPKEPKRHAPRRVRIIFVTLKISPPNFFIRRA